MAKRKRGQPHGGAADRTDDFDPRQSKLAIKTYEDVGDSEDEFHTNRDQILLDRGPGAKRRKQREQDDMELSDEEVLGYSESEDGPPYDDEEEDEEMGDDDDDADSQASRGASADEEEDEISGWGSKKSDYYNADEAETEQDMLDEEAEARRIQQKQRKALAEADFGFDEEAWADAGEDDEAEGAASRGGIVTEVLPQLQVTEDMSPSQRLAVLKSRYPEFEPLANEFVRLRPVHEELAATFAQFKAQGELALSEDEVPLDTVKFCVLSGYMGALAMYFALLTSTAEEDVTKSLPMPANDLREHDVIESLEHYQKLWSRMEELDAMDDDEYDDVSDSDAGGVPIDVDDDSEEEVGFEEDDEEQPDSDVSISAPTKVLDVKSASQVRREARMRKTEEALAGLSSFTAKSARKPRQISSAAPIGSDDNSDIGDEQPLLPHEAAEKARKRKSLRFYTSQIAQKANKRANAGRAAGGDDDVPYRERLRDRQERLNREAQNRGSKHDLDGADLDGDEDTTAITNRDREEMDDGERALELRVQSKKNAKLERDEAYRIAKEEGGKVVVRKEAGVGADGRRQVGYVIEKNKGLTPKRKKIAKNPRVKKRMKYEEKTKKLRTMKATYKGGEAKGGYGGELTGIKKNLVRSTKL